jgi:hypothetical protein
MLNLFLKLQDCFTANRANVGVDMVEDLRPKIE